ncbi:glycosyltransferase family 4 protein [Marinobacterium rhizophilum]|uniref:Glycosyltransferase family 4 protein n=1 Tax=Marinobacterium rhizophilum TaxID=420402 RepID=A0ABY5HE09_9GAMM|nr:glycosyltransferase family 4 protein [Marinobacterium rhizophilum]UTW10588.1 glycosyltransferase family 4 protein [Marinobacterium rhizophilum]
MKVVQVLPALEGGGVEKGTLEVARALVSQGHESIVISAGGRLVAPLERDGSRHVTWDLGRKSPWTLRNIWALRRWLRQEKPDILHLRSRMPAWVAWHAWKGLPESERPRLVTTVHGLYSVSGYSGVMCRGERVIAVSETVENYIRDNYPQTDMARVRRIYRGIDPLEFPFGYQPEPDWLERWKSEYPALAGKQLLTLPGRLTRLKGHNDFIDLLQALKTAGLPVHGLIVGGEDPKRRAYAREIRERIQSLGLGDDITLTGGRDDIRDIYAVSSLVLSLSTKPESFGRTVAEALSLGVPVAGYAHGGVGEILGALYPAGAVPLGDSEALVTRVTALLKGGERPTGNAVFLQNTMLEQTLAVYRELCA